MIIDILGDKSTPAYKEASKLVKDLGHYVSEGKQKSDLAIAPLLTAKIPDTLINRPSYGTLVFHPSPLPYGRGKSSIKQAYKRKEPITTATWFWANEKFDAGDICEQEVVKIDYALRPREFYEKHIIPAMKRTLQRCLLMLSDGVVRRVPQVKEYATFD